MLEACARSAPIRLYQIPIWKCLLGILVQILHVRVGGSAVEVKVVFLYILAVIALAVGDSKQTFLQDRIPTVPQSYRKAKLLLVIRDPSQTVFSPSISARACLVVGEVVPCIPVLAVVLTNCAPLPFTEIWPPFSPWNSCVAHFVQTSLLISFRPGSRGLVS